MMENNKSLDAALQAAAKSILDDEAKEFLRLDTSEMTVSRKTKRRIQAALRQCIGVIPTWRQVVAVCLIICSVAIGAGLCVPELRASIWNAVTTWFGDHFEVSFKNGDADVSGNIEKTMLPSYIPEGWEIVDRGNGSFKFISCDGKTAYFYQLTQNTNQLLDNTECKIKEYELSNGITALVFVYEDGRIVLTWQDGDVFSIDSRDLTLDEMIKIAESIEE